MIQLVSVQQTALDIITGRADQEIIQCLFNDQLSLSEFETLECLVFLLFHAPHRSSAYGKLQGLPIELKVEYAGKKEANPKVQFFLLMEALKRKDISIIKAQIENPQLPDHLLTIIASEGDLPALKLLIDNPDRMASNPQLAEIMKKNPVFRAVSERTRGKRKETESAESSTGMPDNELLLKATIEAMLSDGDASGETPGSGATVKNRAITLIQHIMRLSVAERLKLAYKGNRSERTILLNDSNKVVALAVLSSPKISADEILQIANNRAIDGEIIARIASNREWTKTYAIVQGLLHNPKTPVSYAMGFIKQLHDRDLKMLLSNRNINPAIRHLARNFSKSKENR